MEPYRTEEEQVEALRRWWQENGRSTIVAIVLALGVGFGYQGWKDFRENQADNASDLYQRVLQALSVPALSAEQEKVAVQLAEQLKADYSTTTYAQFAALQLARVAVERNDLAEAQAQLRWALGKADKGSDVERIAQLRLARVLGAGGEVDQALAILAQGKAGPYQASYEVARGDILLNAGRSDEARDAYTSALAAADSTGLDLVTVRQKLLALNPKPARARSTEVGETADQARVDTAAPASDGGSSNEE
ncbi:MAG: tetratricopeptide repeat protein [Halioglobus sp.]|nr:tetratricopeptide repeat protein [Halioglobus sp.]MBP6723973.1 tetratricopeptide repeat protein [Halioglobus sp.]